MFFIFQLCFFFIFFVYLHHNKDNTMINGYTIIKEDASDIIEKYVNTSIDVIKFIINLPAPLSQFVFRQIVCNGYKMASVLPKQEQKDHLLKAVSLSIELSKQTAPVYCYLNVEHHYRRLDEAVQQMDETTGTELLFNELKHLCSWDTLPDSAELIHAFDCFSFSDNGNTESLREIIRMRLEDVLYENPNIDKVLQNSHCSCFLQLGYQTFFEKWIASMLDATFDDLFVKWYCKGEVLDIVIDTIANCGVYTVSQSLFERVVSQCAENYHLSNIVQQRYDYYRQFTASLSPYQFVYKGVVKQNQLTKSMALPKITKSATDTNPIDESNLYDLWALLKKHGDIECEFLSFQSVFSGAFKETRPIRWLRDQNSLAVFLYILRAKHKADKDYAKKAASAFLQKNGKQCSENTLNQANTQASCYREYVDLFNEANIKR